MGNPNSLVLNRTHEINDKVAALIPVGTPVTFCIEAKNGELDCTIIPEPVDPIPQEELINTV